MKTVELSFHIQNVPCPEEIMAAGTCAHYDAYFVKIPIEFFPKELINAMERHFDKKQYEFPMKQFVSQISLVKPIEDGENQD